MFDEGFLAKCKEDFPALSMDLDGSPVNYLDNAATTLKPKCMADAVNEYYLGISSNVHRGKHFSLEEVSNRYEQARYKVAELISCSANEVVFLRNTTEALNLVANGLGLTSEQTVIVFSDSHHSNLLPWMANADVRFVKLNQDGDLDLDHYLQLLKLKPAVVAVTHCSNVTGVYAPLEKIIAPAKAAGAVVVVDAAQSVPHRKVNVTELGVDFLAFSAHKMLGPTGLGVLYGNKEKLLQLTPNNVGGGMVDWVDTESYRLRKIPHRFEAGTPHIAGAYGIAVAIDYLQRIGFDALQTHEVEMGAFMFEQALKRNYLIPINCNSQADRGAIISLAIPGLDNLDDVARILSDSYGIMCRNGHLCAQPYIDGSVSGQVLRASAYFYNSQQNVLDMFEALDEIVAFLLPEVQSRIPSTAKLKIINN